MKKEELHHIKSSGFKTPKGYFKGFNDELFNRLNEEDPIGLPQDSGFKVPDNYFETLEQSIAKKISPNEEPKVIPLHRKKWYYLTSAVAVIVISFSIFWNTPIKDNSITYDMVELHFENSELNSYELAELLTETDFLETDFQLVETNYNEDDIEDYLTENSDIETMLLQ